MDANFVCGVLVVQTDNRSNYSLGSGIATTVSG
jgi:hypothetical protein